MNQQFKNTYLQLVQKLEQLSNKVEYGTKPALQKLWQEALEIEVSAADMTAYEVQKIAGYLARDLKVISEYNLAAEEGLLAVWQRDSDYVTYKLLNLLSKVEDPTIIEWHKLGLSAHNVPVVFTAGELTSLDVLQCEKCKKQHHFNDISEIPVCSCGHRTYVRVTPAAAR